MQCRVCHSPNLKSLGGVEDFPFVECSNCAFTFSPTISREWLEEQYSNGFHGARDGAPASGWASEPTFLQPALEMLKDRHPLRILDFGTGQSWIPDHLRELGHRVIGLDLDPPLRPHPDRLTGNLLELQLDGGQFDLIFSFQVFEHLPEPGPFLAELLRLTKPGGLLLIHTDMETEEREKGFTDWWYVLPPDHCVFFKHRTFEVMLQGTPHRVCYKDPCYVIIEKAP